MRWDWPKQTILGFGDKDSNGIVGDCFRCCIAAVLQLPAVIVPHFVKIALETGKEPTCLAQAWLSDRGFWFLQVDGSTSFGDGHPIHLPHYEATDIKPFPIICTGPTVRSKNQSQTHCVVMAGSEILYDPHPSEAGLLAINRRYLIVPQPLV